jgi:hypothetical protein
MDVTQELADMQPRLKELEARLYKAAETFRESDPMIKSRLDLAAVHVLSAVTLIKRVEKLTLKP